MKTIRTLYFPEKIIIKFLDTKTNQPIPQLIITISLFASRKNNYNIGPMPSNDRGEIILEKTWVTDAITYLKNTYPMDYESPINSCSPNVCIKTMSNDDINKAIKAMEVYKIESGAPDINHTVLDLKNANNIKYRPKEIFILLDSPSKTILRLDVKLEPRET